MRTNKSLKKRNTKLKLATSKKKNIKRNSKKKTKGKKKGGSLATTKEQICSTSEKDLPEKISTYINTQMKLIEDERCVNNEECEKCDNHNNCQLCKDIEHQAKTQFLINKIKVECEDESELCIEQENFLKKYINEQLSPSIEHILIKLYNSLPNGIKEKIKEKVIEKVYQEMKELSNDEEVLEKFQEYMSWNSELLNEMVSEQVKTKINKDNLKEYCITLLFPLIDNTFKELNISDYYLTSGLKKKIIQNNQEKITLILEKKDLTLDDLIGTIKRWYIKEPKNLSDEIKKIRKLLENPTDLAESIFDSFDVQDRVQAYWDQKINPKKEQTELYHQFYNLLEEKLKEKLETEMNIQKFISTSYLDTEKYQIPPGSLDNFLKYLRST